MSDGYAPGPGGYRLNEILPGRFVFTYEGDSQNTPEHHICTNCYAAKKNPSVLHWMKRKRSEQFVESEQWALVCRLCNKGIGFPDDFDPHAGH